MPIKHAKTNAVTDAADTGLVRPSDWNADHTGENYATVQDEGTNLTQRPTLNFTGTGVTATDDAAGLRTKVAIPGSTFIRKTADESVTSSTVLQDDDALLFAVAANEVWEFVFGLEATAASLTPDFKATLVGPAGSTVRFGSPAVYFNGAGAATTPRIEAGGTTIDFQMDTGITSVTLRGIIVNGATAGDCKLQWAQNTSSADATTVKAQSYLVANKVA